MLRRIITRLSKPKQPAPVDDFSQLLAVLPQFSIARLGEDKPASEGV